MIRIINLRNYELLEDEILVKVDRSSVLGNPFKMNSNTDKERIRVISEYAKHYKEKIQTSGKFFTEMYRIHQLLLDGNKVALGCWCYPKFCHAEVIKEKLEGMLDKN